MGVNVEKPPPRALHTVIEIDRSRRSICSNEAPRSSQIGRLQESAGIGPPAALHYAREPPPRVIPAPTVSPHRRTSSSYPWLGNPTVDRRLRATPGRRVPAPARLPARSRLCWRSARSAMACSTASTGRRGIGTTQMHLSLAGRGPDAFERRSTPSQVEWRYLPGFKPSSVQVILATSPTRGAIRSSPKHQVDEQMG